MKPEKDNIKKVFSSKLGDSFDQEPPAFMWERIDAQLNALEQQAGSALPKAQPRRLVYRLTAWSAGVAAAVALSVWLFMPEQRAELPVAINETPIEDSSAVVTPLIADSENIIDENKDLSIQSETNRLSNKTYVAAVTAQETLGKKNSIASNNESDLIVASTNVLAQQEQHITTNDNEVLVAENKTVSTPETKQSITNEDFERKLSEEVKSFEESGVYNTNLLADNQSSHANLRDEGGFALGVNGGGAFSKADPDYKRVANPMAITSDGQALMLRSSVIKMDHNQPITLGLNINKRITDRVSVESGITYTYLSSKARSVAGSDMKQRDTQVFHYLGIPLSINYTFAEWSKARFYVSVGGMIQKDVYGRFTRYSRVEDLKHTDRYDKKSISQKNVQLSTTGLVGVSYPIYRKMSLYTNVGGAYYFDAENEYSTIYSEKKWLLNLNLGVKFDF